MRALPDPRIILGVITLRSDIDVCFLMNVAYTTSIAMGVCQENSLEIDRPMRNTLQLDLDRVYTRSSS